MRRGGSGRNQGRKPIDGDVAWELYPVRMPVRLARKARKAGGGNLSEGVRMALEGLQLDNSSVESQQLNRKGENQNDC